MKLCSFGYSPLLFLFLSFNFLLAACLPAAQASFAPNSSPTVMPSPTNTWTAIPSPTATITPTPTLTRTPTATARVNFILGDEVAVEDGGFSFQPVVGYDLNLRPGVASIVSEDGGTILTMTGTNVSSPNSIVEFLEQLLNSVSRNFQEFKSGEIYPIRVGEKKGLGANISGKRSGEHFNGRVLMVAPSDSQIFFAFSFVVDTPGRWAQEREGRQAIQSVIDSVEFFNITTAPAP